MILDIKFEYLNSIITLKERLNINYADWYFFLIWRNILSAFNVEIGQDSNSVVWVL